MSEEKKPILQTIADVLRSARPRKLQWVCGECGSAKPPFATLDRRDPTFRCTKCHLKRVRVREERAGSLRRISFVTFLKKQIDRNDPIGDLAGDIKQDKTFPPASATGKEVHSYLLNNGACSEAVEALEAAWREYQLLYLNPSETDFQPLDETSDFYDEDEEETRLLPWYLDLRTNPEIPLICYRSGPREAETDYWIPSDRLHEDWLTHLSRKRWINGDNLLPFGRACESLLRYVEDSPERKKHFPRRAEWPTSKDALHVAMTTLRDGDRVKDGIVDGTHNPVDHLGYGSRELHGENREGLRQERADKFLQSTPQSELMQRLQQRMKSKGRNMIEFYKDGTNLAVATECTEPDAFLRAASKALSEMIDSKKYDKQWQQQLDGWLPQIVEIACKLKGYKAEVQETRRLIAGPVIPQQKDLVLRHDGYKADAPTNGTIKHA